ncbi:MAG: ABC transporter ATP-binding protein [Tannerella sp.]|jgi:ABC-2 type transport system ATP-binding protein|nr:ABC transporter ATP-binding protein [Tannerella sp.]
MMENPLITIRNLRKTYAGASHPSVDGLTLQVGQGAFFGLLGPNGAGKTTTISILCGLRSYDGGEVAVGGFDVRRKMKCIKPLIGVVPQDIALYPELTVGENLRFFGGMYPVPPHELNGRIASYLEDFGLMAHHGKKTGHLSGGMKRQVNLIAALLHRPALLFLDEPTVGVDVHSRRVILENLQHLHRNGMTIVYTSHDMKEAEQLCTHVVLMNHGRTVCEGVPRQLVGEASVSSLEELFISKTLP